MKPGGDVYRATGTTRLHTWFIGRIITLEMTGEEATANISKSAKRKICTEIYPERTLEITQKMDLVSQI